MKKILLTALLFSTCSFALELDDVLKTTTMWSSGDPFGFSVLRATASSNWVNSVVSAHGTNETVHANKLNVSVFTATNQSVMASISSLNAQIGTNRTDIAGWLSWLGTNTYVKAETDSIALSALATNKTLRLFNPENLNEYIDGSGNKYVISNFWNMTFSPDFAHPPAQPSYLFTSLTQSVYQYGSFGVYWMMSPTRVEWRGSDLGSVWIWEATTNAAVLQAGDSALNGFAFVEYWATTNLIATLASQADVGSLTAGLVSTNETRNVRLNTLTVTNNVTAADGTTVIIPRTRTLIDSSSATSADWENRYLYSSGGRLRLDWEGGILTAYHSVDGDSQSIDWINRALMDSGERTAMAWGDRNLQFPTTGVALDWSVDDVLTINGNLSLPGSLTLGGVTKSEWPAASSGAPAVWTNMVWGAAGTNSTYRMYWDITNGTFAVQEILP